MNMRQIATQKSDEGEPKIKNSTVFQWAWGVLLSVKDIIIGGEISRNNEFNHQNIADVNQLIEIDSNTTNRKIYFSYDRNTYSIKIGEIIDIECHSLRNISKDEQKIATAFFKSFNALMDVSNDLIQNESNRKSKKGNKFIGPFDDSFITASKYAGTLDIILEPSLDKEEEILGISNFWLNTLTGRINDLLSQINLVKNLLSKLYITSNKDSNSKVSINSITTYIENSSHYLISLKRQIELLVYSPPVESIIPDPPAIETQDDSYIIKFADGRIYISNKQNIRIEEVEFLKKQIELYDNFYRTWNTMNGNQRISTVNRRTLEKYAKMFNLSIEAHQMESQEVIKFLKFWYKVYANALSFKSENLKLAQNIFNKFKETTEEIVHKPQVEILDKSGDKPKKPPILKYTLLEEDIIDLFIEFIQDEIKKIRDTFDIKYDLAMILNYLRGEKDMLKPFELSDLEINAIIQSRGVDGK